MSAPSLQKPEGTDERRRLPLAARVLALGVVGAALAVTVPAVASRVGDPGTTAAQPVGKQETSAKAGVDEVPLYFEANQGQVDNQVKFLARAEDYTLYLTPDKAVLSLPGDGEDKPGAALHMSLLGGNVTANIAGASGSPSAGLRHLNSCAERHPCETGFCSRWFRVGIGLR